MDQEASLDFPIPNEIIEIVTTYLSAEDLLVLAAVATERLKKCTYRVLRKKLKVSHVPNLLCQMSAQGYLEKIKQIFAFINQENITMEEMGVQTWEFKKNFPKLLCRMSEKRNLEKIKQIFVYINQEKITMEEMGGITDGFKRVLPNLLDQMLHYNQIEAVKLPAFLVSQIPSILCKMSQKGDLDKIKQIFSYVNQENISTEEMGVKTNEVNQPMRPKLVDTNTGYRGRSPLIEAAIFGHHQVCKYLITEQNANLEARDDYQMTALIWAACSNTSEVIKVLLKNNANYKAKSKTGNHAAYYAAKYGYLESLKMLVEEDGDVIDLKGRNGKTALIAASICGRVDVCKYLVEEKNANVDLKDDEGKTALDHISIQPTSTTMHIIKILIKGGFSN